MSDWPSIVKEASRFERDLDKLVAKYRVLAQQKASRYSNSEIADLSEVIERDAGKLLRKIEEFRRRTGLLPGLVDTQGREAAWDGLVAQYKEWEWEIQGDERALLQSGMDMYSVQYPLLGLIAYMREMGSMHRGTDSRNMRLSITAVKEAVRCCAWAGIPHGRKGSADTKMIIQILFEKINEGMQDNSPRLKYPRERYITAARAAYKKHDNTKEYWCWMPTM